MFAAIDLNILTSPMAIAAFVVCFLWMMFGDKISGVLKEAYEGSASSETTEPLVKPNRSKQKNHVNSLTETVASRLEEIKEAAPNGDAKIWFEYAVSKMEIVDILKAEASLAPSAIRRRKAVPVENVEEPEAIDA